MLIALNFLIRNKIWKQQLYTFLLQNEIAMDEVTSIRVHPSGSTQQGGPTYMDLQEATRNDRTEQARPTNPQQSSLSQRADYAPLNPRTRSWEVARDHVKIEKIIGKGAFDQVTKGTAIDLPGRPGKTKVAVKMLKSKTLFFRTIVSGWSVNPNVKGIANCIEHMLVLSL